MTSSIGRSAVRIAAVAASTLLAGIYVYDRAGGDFFGLRAADAPPGVGAGGRNESPLPNSRPALDATPHEQNQPAGSLGPMPEWYTDSIVVTEPYPFINQGANLPQAHVPSAPIDTPQFSDPPRRTVLPGSKSDAGIDISIGLQNSP